MHDGPSTTPLAVVHLQCCSPFRLVNGVWHFVCDGLPLCTDTPAPDHVLHCQLQMKAQGVEVAYLVYWHHASGVVIFKIQRDCCLLESISPVLNHVCNSFKGQAQLPREGFTQSVPGHDAMMPQFTRAMSDPVRKCWHGAQTLAPKYRGDPVSTVPPLVETAVAGGARGVGWQQAAYTGVGAAAQGQQREPAPLAKAALSYFEEQLLSGGIVTRRDTHVSDGDERASLVRFAFNDLVAGCSLTASQLHTALVDSCDAEHGDARLDMDARAALWLSYRRRLEGAIAAGAGGKRAPLMEAPSDADTLYMPHPMANFPRACAYDSVPGAPPSRMCSHRQRCTCSAMYICLRH